MRRMICAAFVFSQAFIATSAFAEFQWADTFSPAASPLWRNESGHWSASNGIYDAANWNNFPNARSSVPFKLNQTDVSVDIVNIQDGGIWVRSAESGDNIGRQGVLLVTGGNSLTGTTLYWHVVHANQGYGPQLAASVPFIISGTTDATVRVTVQGNVYSAYINDAILPATTITTADFPAGEVALYDYSPNQAVDAVRIKSNTVIPGDANVDGNVNFDDLLIVAQGYGTNAGATWINGDFDGSGSVVFDDLLTLAQHYGEPLIAAANVPSAVAGDWSLARSMVPEPTSAFACLALVIALRERRE